MKAKITNLFINEFYEPSVLLPTPKEDEFYKLDNMHKLEVKLDVLGFSIYIYTTSYINKLFNKEILGKN